MRKLKVYLDTSDISQIEKFVAEGSIDGITTNPTLMYKAGVRNYRKFISEINEILGDLPISYEVISDQDSEILNEARIINGLGTNSWVKIPVIKSNGDSNIPLINECLVNGIKVNVTAVFHITQVEGLLQTSKSQCIISIFAGRIADAGIDPEFIIKQFKETEINSKVEILWASVREPFNIIQAERSGCDIITVQPELLLKSKNFGRDLIEYSRETVQMFVDDAKSAGLQLGVN